MKIFFLYLGHCCSDMQILALKISEAQRGMKEKGSRRYCGVPPKKLAAFVAAGTCPIVSRCVATGARLGSDNPDF
jgi:uncharacterized protein (DUF169 family)